MIDKYALSKYVMLCEEIETLEAERESLRMGCGGGRYGEGTTRQGQSRPDG